MKENMSHPLLFVHPQLHLVQTLWPSALHHWTVVLIVFFSLPFGHIRLQTQVRWMHIHMPLEQQP